GLDPNTTYYGRVLAENYDGLKTSYALPDAVRTMYDPALDTSSPTIESLPPEDLTYRRINDGLYQMTLKDLGGSLLSHLQVKVTTGPDETGIMVADWTDAATNIDSANYDLDLTLPADVWNNMIEGATNYVSCKVFDGVGNSSFTADVFVVLKDTTPPQVADNQEGEDFWRTTDGGPIYDGVDFSDSVSRLDSVQYSASVDFSSANAGVIPWTDIDAVQGLDSYAAPWGVDFGALANGVTNYISVRALDKAGNFILAGNVFKILKNAFGPVVVTTYPYAAYHSSVAGIYGTSAKGDYDVKGNEISIKKVPGLYWTGTDFLSAARIWFVTPGTDTWNYNPGIIWENGTTYEVVARSSDTIDNYSVPYSTRTFTFDTSVPSVQVSSPINGASIASLETISGTAADTAPDSGISSVELRLRQLSDGKWWNFSSGGWGAAPVAVTAGNSGSWTFPPDEQLKSSMISGTSYYVTARASDKAVPANSGVFGVSDSTFTLLDNIPPAAVSDLAASSGTSPGSLFLTWTSPGDNGSSLTLSSGAFAIQYSTYADAAFSTSSAQVSISTASVLQGSTRTYLLSGLTPETTYYLRIWTRDEAMNWSAGSNQTAAQSSAGLANAISGRVRMASGDGITGVLVEAFDDLAGEIRRASAYSLADGSGSYRLEGINPGLYRVKAAWIVNDVESSVSKDNIPMGVSGVDFDLEINYTLASISGQIGPLSLLSSRRSRFSSASSSDPEAPAVEIYQKGIRIARVLSGPDGKFRVSNLLPGRYSVRAFNGLEYADMKEVILAEGEELKLKLVWDLLPVDKVYAFPNPARDSVVIRFETLAAETEVLIFDVAGTLVRSFPDPEIAFMGGGVRHANWNLNNSQGEKVASGVYLFMVKAKDSASGQAGRVVKKLAVIR
ncbi:MAG: Ig-like domain-containing protein, partial [bacterium]